MNKLKAEWQRLDPTAKFLGKAVSAFAALYLLALLAEQLESLVLR